MQLLAAVFVRASGAFGLGHVGWCFGLDATLFDDGSVENPLGTPYTPPDADGFWNVATTLPIGPFVTLPTIITRSFRSLWPIRIKRWRPSGMHFERTSRRRVARLQT